jgi:hypothetical protein
MLQKHGYQPTVQADTWRQFPSVRKLETAYIAAENAAPNHGGYRLLALVAQDLARQYEGVRNEPSLQTYLSTPRSSTPIRFKNPVATAATPNLTPSVEAAINTLSQYCERGPGGTPQSILQTHFNLSPETTYHILRESSSNAEAFKRAMTYVPEKERAPLIQSLISQLARSFESVNYEPTLRPFFGPQGPEPMSPQSSPRGPRPSIPPGEMGAPRASERYSTFVSENYSTAKSMSFSVMGEVVEGFGGIVFGNSVTADASLPKIVTISFDNTPGTDRGSLSYHFADGSLLSLHDVLAEDAYAAYHMVYQPLGGATPPAPGTGIGLVSLLENTPSFDCDNKARKINESTKFDLVLHPALGDSDLGWAAVMVDALPIEPGLIRKRVLESKLGDNQANAIQNLFISMDTKSFVHNWKVVDVPMTVAADQGSLIVWNSSPDTSIPVGLRRTAFIEMRPMLKKGFNSGFARDFYQYVPILTKASVDYERVNAFAKVLAVVRLAKTENANFLSAPAVPSKVPTPDAIKITDQGILPTASFVSTSANTLKSQLSKIQACANEVTDSSPALRQKVTELKKLEDAMDLEVLKIYVSKETDDQKKMAILALAKEYEPLLDAKTHEIEKLPTGHYVLDLFAAEDELKEFIQLRELGANRSSSQSRPHN